MPDIGNLTPEEFESGVRQIALINYKPKRGQQVWIASINRPQFAMASGRFIKQTSSHIYIREPEYGEQHSFDKNVFRIVAVMIKGKYVKLP